MPEAATVYLERNGHSSKMAKQNISWAATVMIGCCTLRFFLAVPLYPLPQYISRYLRIVQCGMDAE